MIKWTEIHQKMTREAKKSALIIMLSEHREKPVFSINRWNGEHKNSATFAERATGTNERQREEKKNCINKRFLIRSLKSAFSQHPPPTQIIVIGKMFISTVSSRRRSRQKKGLHHFHLPNEAIQPDSRRISSYLIYWIFIERLRHLIAPNGASSAIDRSLPPFPMNV